MDKEPTTVEGINPQDIAERAIGLWNKVEGTRIQLKLKRSTEDIHSVNFNDKVKVGDNKLDIVIEQDGNLLESLGLDGRFVAGVGIPITANNPSGDIKSPIYGTIIDAFVIVNTDQGFTQERLLRLITHEIGHTLGLGHTNIAHLSDKSKLPVMFYDPLQTKGTVELHLDDVAGLATLYPDSSFETRFGALSGKVTTRAQQPAFGVAVIATPRDKPSDPIGTWSDREGRFFLSGLPPGDYDIHARPLNGSQQVNDMDATIHVGGIYSKALKDFCPEGYNDREYMFCRTLPFQLDPLPAKAGQTLELNTIQEGRDNPSPPPTCSLGSLPLLPNRPPQTLPTNVPLQGTRGDSCPPPQVELSSEQDVLEPIVKDATGNTAEKPPTPEPEAKVEVPVCGCQSTPSSTFGMVVMFLLLVFFRTYLRHTP